MATVADTRAQCTEPDDWTPLDDPATRYLARRCVKKGQPLIEVAEVLGMCTEELAVLLGIEAVR